MGAIRHFLTPALTAMAGFCLIVAPARGDEISAATATPMVVQAAPPLAEYCAHAACRGEAAEIRLNATDGGAYATVSQPYPYADEDGTVIIFAGEAFELSLADRNSPKPQFVRTLLHVDGSGLSGYRPPAPNNPLPSGPATVSFELSQAEGAPNMTLRMRNDTGVPLKFDATMFAPTRDGVRREHTATCPLMPGTMGHETWPYPVVMLVLSNFRRVDGGTLVCE